MTEQDELATIAQQWDRIGERGEFVTNVKIMNGIYFLMACYDALWVNVAQGNAAYIIGYLHGRMDGEGL